ncbi:MAG: D-alanine--D-alanine ligase [Candidatus Zixiibacteriota bacterium]
MSVHKVALIYGGESAEREVSLSTGKAIAKAMGKSGIVAEEFILAEADIYKHIEKLKGFDMVFIGYHGGFGENGHVQSILDMANIRYTGSGAEASMLAMDKNISKILLEKAGVPVPVGICTGNAKLTSDILEKIADIGFPIAVKPLMGGSTIGFTKVEDPMNLEPAIEEALKYDDRAIIEQFIEGQELTVSFLGDRILPPVLIKPNTGLYDYKHKYTKGVTEYICPAPYGDDIIAKLNRYAQAAIEAIGCRNYGRIDFRISDENELFCLEANTLPGMTGLSLVPMAADAVGISFEHLIEEIIDDAFRYFD